MRKKNKAKKVENIDNIKDKKRKISKNINKNAFGKLKISAFIALIIIIVLFLGFAIWKLFIRPANTFYIEKGTVTKEVRTEGYIIRNEAIAEGGQGSNFSTSGNSNNSSAKSVVAIKSEGEKAAKGENVFKYSNSSENDIKSKIQEVDKKINEVQSKATNTINSGDIQTLDKEIDKKLIAVSKENNTDKITEIQNEIENYMSKKIELIANASPKDSELSKLVAERQSYEAQLDSGSTYIKAPIAGVVSYKVDGLENRFTTSDFTKYNRQYFDELNLKTGQIIANSVTSGKVFDNYKCYIATILKKDQLNGLTEKSSPKIRLPNGDEVSAPVEYMQEQSNNDVLVVFKITDEVENLINSRKIAFDIIFWKYSGFKVPNTAIIKENNLAYVVRSKAGYMNRVLIKIEKENEAYSIIDNYTADELKDMGVDASKLTSSNISLYDEIQTVADKNTK